MCAWLYTRQFPPPLLAHIKYVPNNLFRAGLPTARFLDASGAAWAAWAAWIAAGLEHYCEIITSTSTHYAVGTWIDS